MVLPLIPIAIAGAGAAGGFGLGSLFGGGKKEIHAAKEYYAPTTTEVYAPTHAPQLQFSPVSTQSYQGATYIVSSPGAVSKKEQITKAVSKPSQRGEWDLPITVSQEPSHVKDIAGTNLTHIAIIGAVALVAVTVLGKGMKKK